MKKNFFFTALLTSRNDDWNSERPKEEARAYDGPAGMEPEGLIESNWDEVRTLLYLFVFGRCRSSQWSNTHLRGKVKAPCSNLDQTPWGSPYSFKVH
jgi:hypothetical protein